jgi:hypothetical protein
MAMLSSVRHSCICGDRGEEPHCLVKNARLAAGARPDGPALLSAFLLPLEDGKAIVATPVKFFGKVIAQNADIIQSALEEVTGKGIEGVEVQHLELEDTGSD